MARDVLIAPSLLSADFLHLGAELDDIASADLVHFDVMDGNFVSNLSFGTDLLKAAKRGSDLPVDAHLMVSNPEDVVDWYLDAGADIVTFHMEAQRHAHRLCSHIRERGAKAGVALNPGTAISTIEDLLPEVDMVLIMSVNPGFGGQSFIESSLRKIRKLRQMCDEQGLNTRIEVDGGISSANAGDVVAAGADVLVAGSGVFKAADRAAAIADMRAAAALGQTRKA